MDVQVVDKKRNHKLELGDIVSVDKDMYLITKESIGYIARSFDGESGSTGYHNSIEELHESFMEHDFVHYSQEEFELQLKRK